MLLFLFVSLMIGDLSNSTVATQTDWSDGGGVPGPTTDWASSFDNSLYVNYSSSLLEITTSILSSPVYHIVASDYDKVLEVFPADIDGDGDADILGATDNSDGLAWWENTDATGMSWSMHIIENGAGSFSIYTADIDNDGDVDILCNGAHQITWWENTDATGLVWLEHIVDETMTGAGSVYASDIDNDGYVDVIACFQDNTVSWWRNTDGSGNEWTKHMIDYYCKYPDCISTADIDGDSDLDVLGIGRGTYRFYWWENVGGAGLEWIKHPLPAIAYFPQDAFAEDIDMDGDIDILGAISWPGEANAIIWYENIDGAGSQWTRHYVDNCFFGALSVNANDLDGDGDVDVLGSAAANPGDDEIAWWENTDGSGYQWEKHTLLDDFSRGYSVSSSDFDGDGIADALSAAYYEDSILWWKIAGYADQGVLESSILDAGDVHEWVDFTSDAIIPDGTDICYQFRSSANSENMGSWSDTVFAGSSSLSGILDEATRYLQYKVVLQSGNNPSTTPELDEISFSFTLQVGMSENHSSELSLLLSPNPSEGNLTINVTVPSSDQVTLSLYDLTGRMVIQFSESLFEGSHSIFLEGLTSGTYFCEMRAGDFSTVQRVVVLR